MAETGANGHRSAPLRVVFLTGRDHPLTAGLLARLHATPGISLQQAILWPHGRQAQAGLAATCRDLQIPLHVCPDVTAADTITLLKNLNCHVLATCATSAVPEVIARIPSAGCLGLYHGDAPAWTGASSTFWALWNRAAHVSAAVALPGDGRNSEVVCRQTIPLCPYDDLTSSQAKLDELSMSIYPRALRELAAGGTDHSSPAMTIQSTQHPNLAQKLTLHVRLFFSRLNLYQLVRRFVRDSGYLVVLLAEKVKQIWLRLSGSGTLTVLYYHRVSDLCRDAITIGVKDFAQQIRYLKKHYTVWKADDLITCLQAGGRLRGGHNVLITFDDGYEDNYSNAFPILKQHGCEAIFFISTGLIDSAARFAHDLDMQPDITFSNMTWRQVQTMAADGMSIGVHSHSHADLGGLSHEAAVAEINRSLECFSHYLHNEPQWMSFPFGKAKNYTAALIEHVKKNTPLMGLFSAAGHINQGKVDAYTIQRINIGDGDTGLAFIYKLRGGSRDLFMRDPS